MADLAYVEVHRESLWMENIGEIIFPDKDGEYIWVLPEIFLSDLRGYCIASPCFTFDNKKWHLVFTPGYSTSGILKNYASLNLFLWMKDCITAQESYKVRLSCEDRGGEEISCVLGETAPKTGSFGKESFIEKRLLLFVSTYGRTKIICQIQKKKHVSSTAKASSDIEEDENTNEINNSVVSNEKQTKVSDLKGVDRLVENLRNILIDEQDTDVVLKTNDHEFRAHRIFLQARSPVLASMFHHDMTEKKTGEIDISDCSTAAFGIFLQFLYTGNADTMSSENVVDLYYIADKYQVDDLKSDCVEFMKNSLSIENFCDVMALSIRHSESELQKFATEFFSRNIKKIVKTVKWQKYISDYPIQANELYIKAFNI